MATWTSRPTWHRLWSLTRLLPPCPYLSYLSEVIPSLATSPVEEVVSLWTQPALTSHRFVYSFRHAPNLVLFVKRNNPLPGFRKVSNNTCVSGWLPTIIYMAQISPVLLIHLMCPTDRRGQNDVINVVRGLTRLWLLVQTRGNQPSALHLLLSACQLRSHQAMSVHFIVNSLDLVLRLLGCRPKLFSLRSLELGQRLDQSALQLEQPGPRTVPQTSEASVWGAAVSPVWGGWLQLRRGRWGRRGWQVNGRWWCLSGQDRLHVSIWKRPPTP